MKARIITILAAVPIIWGCTYHGGIPFLLLVLVLALASINEFYSMMMKKGYYPAFWVGNLIAIFFIVFAYFAMQRNWEPAQSAILTVAVTVAAISGIFLKREKDTIVDVAITILGMIFIGWFFSYLIFIRSLTVHGGYLFFLMLTIWANDVVAYLAGRYFGKHKLAPQISPNKTWEGAAAGFLTCILAAEIFSGITMLNGTHALILGSIIGIMAQLSDLVESLIKRDAGVKDSSNIIPGHGGVLDRMDSFILTAPLMYYYVVWFIIR
ncbi:MAG: phosphatidate cytidylyltransferase [Candidatus Saganbacteria bacterium]|uniref:Phosphatidate cytidylyltransferase n=1 Tax=Candidatus Saganbacteria bacterium TaxID=2575572 RepID=A0A833L109_UNCSA|nr:MAG: phosphatidate cytidylyltransferase [Candidatus Saganbacteria bacterium]